jgi:transposase
MPGPRQIGRSRHDPALVSFDVPPTCRASIRGATVTLNRWSPGMAARGPVRAAMEHVGAALADLHRDGDELIVAPLRGAPWHELAEHALLRWAARVGYRRVWLPGRVVDLAHVLPFLGWAAVTCPTCGARWEDGSIEFWEAVRRDGWFPGSCLACGGSLPEWDVAPAAGAFAAEPASVERGDGPRADAPPFAEADAPGDR